MLIGEFVREVGIFDDGDAVVDCAEVADFFGVVRFGYHFAGHLGVVE